MKVIPTLLLSAVLAVGLAGPVAAQTSTTLPPVRSIPVTPAPTTSATAPPPTALKAPAAASATQSSAPAMADTGLPADRLVPFGFMLIALGAVLTGGARRARRPHYSYL